MQVSDWKTDFHPCCKQMPQVYWLNYISVHFTIFPVKSTRTKASDSFFCTDIYKMVKTVQSWRPWNHDRLYKQKKISLYLPLIHRALTEVEKEGPYPVMASWDRKKSYFDILHLELFKSWCEKSYKPVLPLISFLLTQRVNCYLVNTTKSQKSTCLANKVTATWNLYKNIHSCFHK